MKKLVRTTQCRLAVGLIAFLLCSPGNILSASIFLKSPQREAEGKPEKVEHAEPLYNDLIRDLGTLEGEMEFNAGFGVNDAHYEGSFEYEFSPLDRLGLELEVPFNIHSPVGENVSFTHRIEALKTGIQWTYFVSEEIQTSMAVGYSNELLFHLPGSTSEDFLKGNAYKPFIVAAKHWGGNFHTLVMAGAEITQDFEAEEWHTEYQINTSLQYVFSDSPNVIGVELNKVFAGEDFGMDVRPHANLALTKHVLLGVMVGIPVSTENRRVSSFLRLIYEMD